MALTKVQTGGLAADSVDNTILDVTDDFAFTGTVSGAGLSSPLGNTVTVTSEGGSNTTNLVQGLAKVLFGANLRSSETMGIANNDVSDMNLNITSLVDAGTGLLTGNITNAMSSKQYIWTEGTLAANNTACLDVGVATTSLLRIQQRDADSSTITDAISCTVVHGDLA